MNVNDRPKPKVRPRPISIAYDAGNYRLLILCDDGSLWKRYSEQVADGEVKWRTEKIENLILDEPKL